MKSTLKALILPVVDAVFNFLLSPFVKNEIPLFGDRDNLQKVESNVGEPIQVDWTGRYDWDIKPDHPTDIDFFFQAPVEVPSGKKLVYSADSYLEVFEAAGKVYLNVGLLPRMRDVKLYVV